MSISTESNYISKVGEIIDIDKEALFKSGIKEKYITEAMVTSFDSDLAKDLIGYPVEGYGFPYFSIYDGTPLYFRVRKRIVRSSKEPKYLCPRGSKVSLYFLQSNLDQIFNKDLPLYITEGEKKLLSLISNYPETNLIGAVSFPGCWNFGFKDKDNHRQLLEEFELIPLKNRRVILIPDTDYFSNQMVKSAMSQLIRLLIERGARLELVDIRVHEYEKIGVDDFIYRYGFSALAKRINHPLNTFEKFLKS